MSRRVIWWSLGVVAAVLVGASYLADPARWSVALDAIRAVPWRAWMGAVAPEIGARLNAYPLALPIGGGALVVLVALGLLVRRRRRRPSAPAKVPFEQALETALAAEPPEPNPKPSRGRRVATLARDGHAIPEIARRTRLSQDAVRTLLAGGA